jgi:hypothetical protein
MVMKIQQWLLCQDVSHGVKCQRCQPLIASCAYQTALIMLHRLHIDINTYTHIGHLPLLLLCCHAGRYHIVAPSLPGEPAAAAAAQPTAAAAAALKICLISY